MRRVFTLIGVAALAVSSSLSVVSAQTGQPVNADGSYVVADDNGVPNVSGQGDDIIYGDINTGGGGGEVLGDANAVNSVLAPRPNGGPPVMPGAGDGMIAGVPVVPVVPAPPDNTALTTTNLANDSGTTTENVPIDALASDTAAAPDDSGATADDSSQAPVGFCDQYATWYDAQGAYENLGATDADPTLVQEVDPDYDGIACEPEMS
jgi:hypothetical protein